MAAIWLITVLCLTASLASATPPVEEGRFVREPHSILPRSLFSSEFSEVEFKQSGRGANELVTGRIMAVATMLSASVCGERALRTETVAALRGGKVVQWEWTGRDPDPRAALLNVVNYALTEDPRATLRGWILVGNINFYGSFFRETPDFLPAMAATQWSPAEVAKSILLYVELPPGEPTHEKTLARNDSSGLHHTFGLSEFLELEFEAIRGSNVVLTGRIAQFSDSWHTIANWERALRVEQLAPAHGGKVIQWSWTGNDPNPQITLLWLIARALNQEPRATLRGWLVVGRIHLHGSFFRNTEDFGAPWIDTAWAPTEEAHEIHVYIELPPADPTP